MTAKSIPPDYLPKANYTSKAENYQSAARIKSRTMLLTLPFIFCLLSTIITSCNDSQSQVRTATKTTTDNNSSSHVMQERADAANSNNPYRETSEREEAPESEITEPKNITATNKANAMDQVRESAPVLSPLEHLMNLRMICNEAKLSWSSIRLIHPINSDTMECHVTAGEKLSRFTPLIIYAASPVELRKNTDGRELYFKKIAKKKVLVQTSPEKSAVQFQAMRKELKTELPDASTTVLNGSGNSELTALKIESKDIDKAIMFIKSKESQTPIKSHLYSLEISRNQERKESLTMIVEGAE